MTASFLFIIRNVGPQIQGLPTVSTCAMSPQTLYFDHARCILVFREKYTGNFVGDSIVSVSVFRGLNIAVNAV